MQRVLILAALAAAHGAFQGRDAWTVESPRLRVTVLKSGGHIAEILLKEEGAASPLWVQSRPTIDPETYDPAKHERLYGVGLGAKVGSGLAGHNLCFPFWGNPSETEYAAGMTFHGETGVVRWREVAASGDSLTAAADLPESRTRMTRKLRVKDQVVYVEETAENLAAWDRPVGWCEHVTLGPPFLERGVTVIDASLTRGRRQRDWTGPEFAWPNGMAEVAVNLRQVRRLESSPGFVNSFLVDPGREFGWFTAYHPRYRVLAGYVFRRAEFPFLNIWEANGPTMLTRGMEFSNTPVHGTLKEMVKTPEAFGIPAWEWLDAKARLTKRYCAFSARVPEWQGTADVRVAPGKLVVVESGTGREVALAFEGL